MSKEISITALALDCSAALSDAGFADPPAIAYNSASGGPITVVAGYSAIFNHAQQTDCVLGLCTLMEPGCTTALAAQANVQLGASPFAISAIETNP